MNRWRFFGVSVCALMVLLGMFTATFSVAGQATGVEAEAIGFANLRAFPGTDAPLLGEITNGIRYPVIGRSEFYPWLLLSRSDDAQPLGWVFLELVNVYGDVNAVPISSLELSASSLQPAASVTLNATQPAIAATTTLSMMPSTVLPTATPVSGITGTVLGEINIRYGPGLEYPRVGVSQAGEILPIIGWHTALPWVEVTYPTSPTGTGWVAINVIDVAGDYTVLPSTSRTQFAYPTLEPTPSPVEVAQVVGASSVTVSPAFAALGDQLYNLMLTGGFDPVTSQLGAFFLMDLQTGEALTVGDDIAFSGMSINKIAILADVFRQLDMPPDDALALAITFTMVCSENITTNELLTWLGGGSPYTGAEDVSAFLEGLGLGETFIYTPFEGDPFITPEAPLTRTTDADQLRADPDPFNQLTVSQMGALLNGMYQCAYSESGLLLEAYPDRFTSTECRQMLEVMSYNRIGTLIEMGVPETVRVAHKHGWINETHGDAAVVFSPGGAYVLVVALYNPGWLEFAMSEPVIEEMSRVTYNYFNPDAPMLEVRAFAEDETRVDIETCERTMVSSPVITDLMNPLFEG